MDRSDLLTPLRDQLARSADLTDEQVVSEVLAAWQHWMERARILEQAIIKHKDQTRGHSSCWENDLELWRVVDPEVRYPHAEVPPREEFLAACRSYYEGLGCPRKGSS